MTLGRSTSGAIKIKTDGGLRAVSCGCCNTTPPSGCCLYPAQAFIDGLYTVEDLPGTILYRPPTTPAYPTQDFLELTKEQNPQPSEYGSLNTVYYKGSFVDVGGTTAGDTILVEAGLFDNNWAFNILYESAVIDSPDQNCLISGQTINKVKDQFANTYTLNGFVQLTRQSLCEWEYILKEDGEIKAWYYLFFSMPVGSYIEDRVTAFLFERDPVSGKSPAGTYVAYPDGITWTIS